MHESVRVETARACDADELVEFLVEHGFAVRRAAQAVDVEYAEPRLSIAVDRAIGDWLATGNRDLVPVRVGRHGVALRPPAG
jgi:hypothetical protein